MTPAEMSALVEEIRALLRTAPIKWTAIPAPTSAPPELAAYSGRHDAWVINVARAVASRADVTVVRNVDGLAPTEITTPTGEPTYYCVGAASNSALLIVCNLPYELATEAFEVAAVAVAAGAWQTRVVKEAERGGTPCRQFTASGQGPGADEGRELCFVCGFVEARHING